MARDLSNPIHTVLVKDGTCGDEHEFYYRRPNNAEKAAYEASLFQRKGKKMIDNRFKVRLKYGLIVVTGFKEGTIEFDGKPISSDSNSQNFRQDWKTQLEEAAGDLIAVVGQAAFEGTRNAAAEDELEFGIDE